MGMGMPRHCTGKAEGCSQRQSNVQYSTVLHRIYYKYIRFLPGIHARVDSPRRTAAITLITRVSCGTADKSRYILVRD